MTATSRASPESAFVMSQGLYWMKRMVVLETMGGVLKRK
jgi:hypothetical protein